MEKNIHLIAAIAFFLFQTIVSGVYASPELTVNAGIDTAICLHDSTIIGGSPTATGGVGPYMYLWQPASGLNSDTIPNPLAFPDTTTTYLLIVADSLGAIDSSYITITINNLPIVTFNLPQDTFCNHGGIITLSGGSPAAGVYSGNGVTGNQFNPANTSGGTSAITYTYTDSIGCTGMATAPVVVSFFPDSLSLLLVQLPPTGFVTYNMIYAYPATAGTYVWQLDGYSYYPYYNFISPDADSIEVSCEVIGEIVIDTIFTSNNSIRVIVSLAGCVDTSAWLPVDENCWGYGGINEISALSNITIYPNPASEGLNINYTLNSTINLGINVLDIQGRKLKAIAYDKSSTGNYTQHIDVSQLEAGIYILNFVSKEGSLNRRFVKE